MPLQSSGEITLGQVNTELGKSAGASISLNDADVRSLAGLASGQISMSNFYGKSFGPYLTVFGMYGTGLDWNVPTNAGARFINIVSSDGVILSNTPISSPARYGGAGATYGIGRGIFLGGVTSSSSGGTTNTRTYNLVTDTGVYGADQLTTESISNTGSPDAVCACRLGSDRAIFTGWAQAAAGGLYQFSMVPISNTGVIGATYGSGISVQYQRIPSTPSMTQYGGDSTGHKGLLFSHGYGLYTTYGYNTISALGVMQSDVAVPSGVSKRFNAGAAGYGGNKAIYMGGWLNPGGTSPLSGTYSLISNTGVMATDTTITVTFTKRITAGMTQIGAKAIYAYGSPLGGGVGFRVSSLVSNTGVLASEVTCVGATTISRMALGYGS